MDKKHMTQVQSDNVEAMINASTSESGMQVIIISVNTAQQVAFWQRRLNQTRDLICGPKTKVYVVHEDWPGGAGNGLGTLYAFQKARAEAEAVDGIDLMRCLQQGESIAIYHTAGKGTRLAPLHASEWNNKSAVKLPCLLKPNPEPLFMTVLEGVIRQTSVYAGPRKGRLSVFWGDQIFIPSESPSYTPKHHVDILMIASQLPNAQQWEERGLSRYGLLVQGNRGEAQQLEKLDYRTFQELIDTHTINAKKGIGVSLGSFSLSWQLLDVLLSEFSEELIEKKTQLNSDPHFWMAATLPEELYVGLLQPTSPLDLNLRILHNRMQEVRKQALVAQPALKFLGGVDVGQGAFWWDYGQLSRYLKNNLKLLENSEESRVLRQFFGLPKEIPEGGLVIGSKIGSANIKNSLIIGVESENIDVQDSVLINCTVKSVKGQDCLLYNVIDDTDIQLNPGSVRADVFLPDQKEQVKVYTEVARHGGDDWKVRLPSNRFAYEELHDINNRVNLGESQAFAEQLKSETQSRILAEN